MGDIFDDIAGNTGSPNLDVRTPDVFDEVAGNVSPEWNLADSIKHLGSGAVEGTAGLLGLMADIFPQGPSAGKLDFKTSKAIQSVLSNVLPEKDPKYRYARTIGQFATPLPGESLLLQAARAIAAGTGAQAAEDVTGDDKVAPLFGALLGGTAPGAVTDIGALFKRLFTGATQEEIKGSAALAQKEITNLTPSAIEAAMLNTPKDKLGGLMTTAEVTQNPGMAQIEKTLSASDDAARLYQERAGLREDARQSLISDMSSTKAINNEALGSNLINAGESTSEAMKGQARSVWNLLDRKIPVEAIDARIDMFNELRKRSGGLEINSNVRNLIDQFVEPVEGIATSGTLQDIRSDALDLIRQGNLSNYENSLMSKLASKIDDAMATGLPKDQYDIWQTARNLTKDQAETFARGTAGGQLISDKARSSNILKQVFKGDTQSIKELKSATGNNPALMEDVKRGILDTIKEDSQGNLTASKMKSFIDANSEGLKELLGKSHFSNLERILKDLQSEANVSNIAFKASKGNSVTAQKNTVAGVIQDTLLGSLIPGSGVLSKMAETAKATAGIRDAKGVQELLFRAAMDPKFALELSRSPTNQRIFSSFERLANLAKGIGIDAAIITGQDIARPGNPKDNKINMLPLANNRDVSKSETTLKPPSPSGLISRMIRQESRGNPNAVSPKGAQGLMQLMPGTGKEMAEKLGVVYNPFDPEQNIMLGTAYFQEQLEKYGREDYALAAYNMGPNAFDDALKGKRRIPKETRDYVEQILGDPLVIA